MLVVAVGPMPFFVCCSSSCCVSRCWQFTTSFPLPPSFTDILYFASSPDNFRPVMNMPMLLTRVFLDEHPDDI